MYSVPKGPRGILFREYLPVMQPLLNELRDIAKKRNKTVAQVLYIIYIIYKYYNISCMYTLLLLLILIPYYILSYPL